MAMTSSVAGYSTYRLQLQLTDSETNIYSIYGSP
eukprot:COSAG02_NODE_69544_length_198_cov_59.929293_1_plen_33_part_10